MITRRIEVYFDEKDATKKSEHWSTLWDWIYLVRKAANHIQTHLYVQDNICDFFYLTEGLQLKLADQKADSYGMFVTSPSNTTYQLLSEKYKGQLKMSVASMLKQQISACYVREKADVLKGERSIRNYKKTIPMPFEKKDLRNWHIAEDNRNFCFTLFGLPFKTRLGRDRSNNELLIQRAINGEYSIRGSSIQVKKVDPPKDKEGNILPKVKMDKNGKVTKIFLLLVVDIPNSNYKGDEKISVVAHLTPQFPIMAYCGSKYIEIGSKEQYTYRRRQIQFTLSRLKKDLTYCNGGKGRKKKLQAQERYKEKEKNYIKTQMHTYSRKLIDWVKTCNAKTLELADFNEEVKKAKLKPQELVIREWGYYGLSELIKQKASREGIYVKIPMAKAPKNSPSDAEESGFAE